MEHARSDAPRPTRRCRPSTSPRCSASAWRSSRRWRGEKEVEITLDRRRASCRSSRSRDRLRSVVLNLLSNAIEYNRAGGSVARAHARARRTARHAELVHATPAAASRAEQLPHVFEPFYRGGNGRGRRPAAPGPGVVPRPLSRRSAGRAVPRSSSEAGQGDDDAHHASGVERPTKRRCPSLRRVQLLKELQPASSSGSGISLDSTAALPGVLPQ